MAVEISFYQCDGSITKSIAPLLLKVLDEKKKALICVVDALQAKEVDAGLWSYGKEKFIPHVISSDKDFDCQTQPIVIADQEENSNSADYLVLTTEVSREFLSQFSRVFYFYDSLNIEEAKQVAKNFQPLASKFSSYKKESGKWIKTNVA